MKLPFCQVVPKQFAGSHLYTRVERGTVRVKCFAYEHDVGVTLQITHQSAGLSLPERQYRKFSKPMISRIIMNIFFSAETLKNVFSSEENCKK